MLIERALRERVTAVQSGPNDIGLFGATPHTFQTSASDLAAGFAVGEVSTNAGMTQSLGAASTGTANPLTPPESAQMTGIAAFEGGVQTPTASLAARVEGQSFASQSVTGAQGEGSIGSGTSPAITQIAGGSGTVEIVRETDGGQQAQTTVVSGDTVVQHDAGAEIAAAVGAVEVAIAEARANVLAEIEQITASATERIAAIQDTVAGTISGVGASIADLTQSVGQTALQLGTPVLDGVADLPANLDAALDAALPLGGEDVAGGITTLIGMVTEDTGFVVKDVATGVVWPVASLASYDALGVLSADDGVGEIDPGSVLLGIADGDSLLGGLSSHDDHDFGLSL